MVVYGEEQLLVSVNGTEEGEVQTDDGNQASAVISKEV